MTFALSKLAGPFFLPPASLLLLALFGLLFLKRLPRWGKGLIGLSLGLLYLLSTPVIADLLHRASEVPFRENLPSDGGAIVVLGGEGYLEAPEYGGDTVRGTTLERIRYAARLYQKIDRPILVTGGRDLPDAPSIAERMQKVLEEEFKVPVRWKEEWARTTYENALYSSEILKSAGIQKVYLVTHASHMSRARRAFEKRGIEVIPAPTIFASPFRWDRLTVRAFLPTAWAFADSSEILHEWVGGMWYIILDR